nr:hypothetical protein CFP56_48765 [Quercus suber]
MVSLDPVKMLFENRRYLGVCEGDSTPSELIEMQRSGRFPLEKLCKTYDYQDLDQAIEDMHSGKHRGQMVITFGKALIKGALKIQSRRGVAGSFLSFIFAVSSRSGRWSENGRNRVMSICRHQAGGGRQRCSMRSCGGGGGSSVAKFPTLTPATSSSFHRSASFHLPPPSPSFSPHFRPPFRKHHLLLLLLLLQLSRQ